MSGDREEIDRIKSDLRRTKLMKDFFRAYQRWAGSPEDRRIAEEELAAEGWTAPAGPPAQHPAAGVRKGPGRPKWTQRIFWAQYMEAQDRAGADAPDKEIAREFGRGLQQMQRLIRRFGRPRE